MQVVLLKYKVKYKEKYPEITTLILVLLVKLLVHSCAIFWIAKIMVSESKNDNTNAHVKVRLLI